MTGPALPVLNAAHAPVPEARLPRCMSTASSSAEDPIETLLSLAVERLEQGGEPELQCFLSAHPEDAAAIRAGLERLRRLGVLAPPPPQPAEPQHYGEFRVLHRLGAGGMGVVYAAEQTSLLRTVALKVVRPEFLASATTRERFHREIEAIARLQHPGIVPILAVGNDHAMPWFAMEYVEGQTMEAMLAAMPRGEPARATGHGLLAAFGKRSDGSKPAAVFANSYWEACARLVHQVAETMVYVHERGVVHRDLKPSNVIVTPSGQARLLDFGLAHVRDLQRLTRAAEALGSPAYAAPEQLRGEAIDERVDIYGLGVTLYELLARQLPFASSSLAALQQQILAGGAVPIRRHNAAVPRDLEVVCAVAMDHDRSRRYRSMAALAADLDAVLQRRSIAARPLGAGLRLLRAAQRHPAWATAAAAIVLAALLLPLLLWWQQATANARLQVAFTDLASSNRQLAAREREAATNLGAAMHAIEQIQGLTTREFMVGTPRTEDLQFELAREAHEEFERLHGLQPADARIATKAAVALGVFATQLAARDPDRAEALLRQVIGRLDQLRDDPTLVAAGLLKLGELQLRRGQLDAAANTLEDSLCLAREGHARTRSTDSRRQEASILAVLGTLHLARGEPGRCRSTWQAAAEQLAAAQAEMPHDRLLVQDLGVSHNRLGELLLQHDPEAAIVHCDTAIRMAAAALDRQFDEWSRSLLASAFENRAAALTIQQRFAAAEEDHGQALAIRSALLAEHPERVANRFFVGSSWLNFGIMRGQQADYGEAADCTALAAAHLRDALRLAPEEARHRDFLLHALVWQIEFANNRGRPDDAEPWLSELAAESRRPDALLEAARLAIGRARQRRDARATPDVIAAWHDLAVACVERAIAAGFADAAHFTDGEAASVYADLAAVPRFAAAVAKLGVR
jgi:tRNA A-37 threonylcarbamoyl transferase component Bud32